MERAVSKQTRRELIIAVGVRYRAGTMCEKRLILDELVAVTGYHRKHAIRLLSGQTAAAGGRVRPQRRLYNEAVQEALGVLWEASDRVCGKRLKPLLPVLVPALERHGHLRVLEVDSAEPGMISALQCV